MASTRVPVLAVALCICSCYGMRSKALDGLEEIEQGMVEDGMISLKQEKSEADVRIAAKDVGIAAKPWTPRHILFYLNLIIAALSRYPYMQLYPAPFFGPRGSNLEETYEHSPGKIEDKRLEESVHGSRKVTPSHVSLKKTGQQFRACLTRTGDVNIASLMEATEQYTRDLQKLGSWTSRGIDEARHNLRVIKGVRGKTKSMRQLLKDQLLLGARNHEGALVSGSGAEAVLWLRLDISFWVETFKERLQRREVSLRKAIIKGYERSMGPYVSRAAKMAFRAATKYTVPSWDKLRECMDIVGSEEDFVKALEKFVRDVEPVLKRMEELQKEFGLAGYKTPSYPLSQKELKKQGRW